MATIKLTNGVLFNTESIKMGIDSNNILASGVSSYTTLEECYVRSRGNAYQLYLTIDGQNILMIHNQWGGNGELDLTFFCHKGQSCTGNGTLTVFALK